MKLTNEKLEWLKIKTPNWKFYVDVIENNLYGKAVSNFLLEFISAKAV